jgi:hypothetical protein
VCSRHPHASHCHQRFVTRTAATSWPMHPARRLSVRKPHVRHSYAVTCARAFCVRA